MRKQQTVRGLSLIVALTAVGCGSVLQSPDSGADSRSDTGSDGGGVLCRQLNEADCGARTDCAVGRCAGVCGGGSSFAACYDPASEAPPPCVGLGIACPAACSTMTTEDSCDARPDCHSVFVDPGTCGCATIGCCARFSRCADGKAVCTSPQIACEIVTPHCEAPAFVVSYTSNCYEGCVRAAACGVN